MCNEKMDSQAYEKTENDKRHDELMDAYRKAAEQQNDKSCPFCNPPINRCPHCGRPYHGGWSWPYYQPQIITWGWRA